MIDVRHICNSIVLNKSKYNARASIAIYRMYRMHVTTKLDSSNNNYYKFKRYVPVSVTYRSLLI